MRIHHPTWAKFWFLKLFGSSAVILQFDHKVVLTYRAKHLPKKKQKKTRYAWRHGNSEGAVVSVHELVLWLEEAREGSSAGVMLNFRFAVVARWECVCACGRCWLAMSDILMKEMESVSLSTESKEEERGALQDSVSSFLLVDEQERLRVKFNSVSSCW